MRMKSADQSQQQSLFGQAAELAVTVVVPCRNERNHIEACIRSIMGQGDVSGGFEVIVADGMSDDGTRDILNTLTAEFDQLTVVDNPRRITPVALNIGIRQARGANIAILGAHTIYDPHYLATCLQLLEEHPDVAGVGGPIRSKGKSPFGRAVARAMSHPLGIGNAYHRHPDYEGYGEGACFPVYRREIFARHGLFDEELVRNQDDEFSQRIAQNGERIFISYRAVSDYYVRETPRTLFKQYFFYGLWRVVVLRMHKAPYSLRQMVPVSFFTLMLLLLVLGYFLPTNWSWLGFTLPVSYVAALALSIPGAIHDVGWGAGLRFPLAVMILHIAYAVGFVRGLQTDPRPLRHKSEPLSCI